MNVIGLDLSLRATGVANHDGTTITLHSDDLRGIERIRWITDQVLFTLELPSVPAIDLVVIEDALFGIRNNTIGELVMLHGALRLAFHRQHQPFTVVAPATVKKYATGAGNAKKPDMRMELYKRAGIDLPDDNQVDAWWLRAAALEHYGAPVVVMPQVNRDALTKVVWPVLPVADSRKAVA